MDCALFFYNSNETCSQLKPGEKYSKNDNRPMNTSTKYGTKEHMAKYPKKQSMLNSALTTASSKDEMRNQTSEKLSM